VNKLKQVHIHYDPAKPENLVTVEYDGNGFKICDTGLLERVARFCLELWQDEQSGPIPF
jgi:hypothetical protein